MPVLFWLYGPEWYLTPYMMVVYPRELSTLLFACYWCNLLLLVHFLSDISCVCSFMVHPPLYNTPNGIIGVVFIFGIMLI